MTDSRGVLREVAWREVFPWLLILRCFRLAIHPSILGIALLAALLTPLGWRAAQWAVLGKSVPVTEEDLAKDLALIQAPVLDDVSDPVRREALQAAYQQRLTARKEMWLLAAELTRWPGVGRVHDPNIVARVAQPLDALSSRSPLGYVFYRFSEPILRV